MIAKALKKFEHVNNIVPRSIKQLIDWVSDKLNIEATDSILRRLLRALGFTYKRMRKSCSHKRDEVLFEFFKEELAELIKLEDAGEIDLFSFDEMGVNLSPVVPYGWQKKGKTNRLSSLPSSNQTVVGFVNRACKFRGIIIDGAATADVIKGILDEFAEELEKKTILLIDNASIHTAKIIMEKIPEWRKKTLFTIHSSILSRVKFYRTSLVRIQIQMAQ